MNAKEKKILQENPCKPDCPRRRGGCAIDCPEWAAFVADRQQIYAARKAKAETCCNTYAHNRDNLRRQRDKQHHSRNKRR